MTDTKCHICGHALEEHAPYVVWHTGWDGCEECDRDYGRGVSLCPVCIDALGYMGMTLGGNSYETDDLCTREDIERWTTVPGEYDPETER